MNYPTVAAQSFNKWKHDLYFRKIVKIVGVKLKKMKNSIKRARYVYREVDEKMEELFEDSSVKKLVKCGRGCHACCHTQVSVTQDEAKLLAQYIAEGVTIDWDRLAAQVEAKDSARAFYTIPFSQRKCIFLGDEGECRVYQDRPSVCRTNYVVSDPRLCSTAGGLEFKVQLLKTYQADMVVYAAFKNAKRAGVLPSMIWRELEILGQTPIAQNSKKRELDRC